jgi:hypothetical protein
MGISSDNLQVSSFANAGNNVVVTDSSGNIIKSTITVSAAAATQYDCTVGSSTADYTTIANAYNAGKRRILVTGSYIETVNASLSTNVLISGISNDISIGFSGAGRYTLYSGGYMKIQDLTIAYDVSAYESGILIGPGWNTPIDPMYVFENVIFKSPVSPSASTGIIQLNGGTTVFSNCKIIMNSGGNSIGINVSTGVAQFNHCNLVGMSSNSQNAVKYTSNNTTPQYGSVNMDNIVISGSWSTLPILNITAASGYNGGMFNNIIVTNLGVGMLLRLCGQINNLYGGDFAQQTTGVTVDMRGGSLSNFCVNNITVTNTQTNTNYNTYINNGLVTTNSAVTIGGNGTLINNVRFYAATVTLPQYYEKMIGCVVGQSYLGTKTIIAGTGAHQISVIGCTTEADVSDNGSGTILSGNSKF